MFFVIGQIRDLAGEPLMIRPALHIQKPKALVGEGSQEFWLGNFVEELAKARRGPDGNEASPVGTVGKW